MFTYGARNIVHKQSSDNINILYYPSTDLIDDIVTDWSANFFIITDRAQSNKIKKDNVCYTSNISLFEYDFILSYHLNDSILSLSSTLHIPIVLYLTYGSYDDSKIPEYKNVFYIVEHTGESEQDKLLTLVPNINKEINNIDNNICLFINKTTQDSKLPEILLSKIKNLSIVDEERVDQKAMVEILSNHRLCIDLYPKSIYKMLYCAHIGAPYLTVQSNLTENYKKIYDGLFFIDNNLEELLGSINRLSSNTVRFKTILPKSNNQTQSFIQKIKTKGMIL
jgi:hypothetical protein